MTDREVVELQAQRQSRPALLLSAPVHTWSHDEIRIELNSVSQVAKARKAVHAVIQKQSRALSGRDPVWPIELRRMEFQAVIEIARALGLEIVYENLNSGDTANE